MTRVFRLRSLRIAVAAAILGVAVVLLIWRGPNLHLFADAFTAVRWRWVVVAIGLNLASVVVRAVAWRTVIAQAMPAPVPRFPLVFSAFAVGLFANAVLPGRIGELARVAVLTRRLPPQRRGDAWPTLVGTVVGHRVFDLLPTLLLILYVLATARVPAWAITSLEAVVAIGFALLAVALVGARRHHRAAVEGLGAIRRVLAMVRNGLGVMHTPVAAATAATFQCLGWLCQLLAVYTAMRAFDIHSPLPAAGLVLLLMNVATIFPLWPGNVGLVQAAIALPLVGYGIAYPHGVAYGFGLQAIEASVGVGVGLLFLAREGLSFGMVRVMPDASQAELPQDEVDATQAEARAEERDRSRARVSG
jgi:uncharacterized protein (TIRG00374 family)